MKYKWSAIVVWTLFPLLMSSLLYLIFRNVSLIELTFFVFGIIELILLVGRSNRNDRLNMQEYGTTKVDKTSDDYVLFRRTQRLIFLSSVINLLFAYLSFIVFGSGS
jgi:hypothetical protein